MAMFGSRKEKRRGMITSAIADENKDDKPILKTYGPLKPPAKAPEPAKSADIAANQAKVKLVEEKQQAAAFDIWNSLPQNDLTVQAVKGAMNGRVPTDAEILAAYENMQRQLATLPTIQDNFDVVGRKPFQTSLEDIKAQLALQPGAARSVSPESIKAINDVRARMSLEPLDISQMSFAQPWTQEELDKQRQILLGRINVWPTVQAKGYDAVVQSNKEIDERSNLFSKAVRAVAPIAGMLTGNPWLAAAGGFVGGANDGLGGALTGAALAGGASYAAPYVKSMLPDIPNLLPKGMQDAASAISSGLNLGDMSPADYWAQSGMPTLAPIVSEGIDLAPYINALSVGESALGNVATFPYIDSGEVVGSSDLMPSAGMLSGGAALPIAATAAPYSTGLGNYAADAIAADLTGTVGTGLPSIASVASEPSVFGKLPYIDLANSGANMAAGGVNLTPYAGMLSGTEAPLPAAEYWAGSGAPGLAPIVSSGADLSAYGIPSIISPEAAAPSAPYSTSLGNYTADAIAGDVTGTVGPGLPDIASASVGANVPGVLPYIDLANSGIGGAAATAAAGSGLLGTLKSGIGAIDTLGGLVQGGGIATGLNLLGGYLQGQSAENAAEKLADAQLRAAQIAADAAKFRPIGVTTRFGKSGFTYDQNGNLVSAGYELSPDLKAQQDKLMGASNQYLDQYLQAQNLTSPMLTGAQSMFNLGSQYLGTSPQDQAAKYMSEQQALLAPYRQRDLADLRSRLQAQGRIGLSMGATDTLSAANPELEAFYNAQRMQDLGLAAQATQGGMDYAKFGSGMLGAGGNMLTGMYGVQSDAYKPYSTAWGGSTFLEGLGQQPMDIGINIGAKGTAARASAGELIAQGMTGAARSMYPANSQNMWADVLAGAGNLFNQYNAPASSFSYDPGKFRLVPL